MSKMVFFMGAVMIAAPASAGCAVPTPEAGVGFAALAMLGAGYAYLRKKGH